MAITYRITLERESDGRKMYAWGGIGAAKVRPLVTALNAMVSFLSRAVNARRALTELLGGQGADPHR